MQQLVAKDYKKHEAVNHVNTWISSGFNKPEDTQILERLGAYLADRYYNNKYKKYDNGNNAVSTSQIRIAYGELTRLSMKDEVDPTMLNMLKARMAYAAARQKNKETYLELKKLISDSIDLVLDAENVQEQKNRFRNLSLLFEAILAYHKAYGGD